MLKGGSSRLSPALEGRCAASHQAYAGFGGVYGSAAPPQSLMLRCRERAVDILALVPRTVRHGALTGDEKECERQLGSRNEEPPMEALTRSSLGGCSECLRFGYGLWPCAR